MEGSIAIVPADRKTLLQILRAATGIRSRRAHIVLMAAGDWSVRRIRLGAFASFDFIAVSVRLQFQQGMPAFPNRRHVTHHRRRTEASATPAGTPQPGTPAPGAGF